MGEEGEGHPRVLEPHQPFAFELDPSAAGWTAEDTDGTAGPEGSNVGDGAMLEPQG